jgi:hypothetical protein
MTGSEDHLLMNVVWLYIFEATLQLWLRLPHFLRTDVPTRVCLIQVNAATSLTWK